MALQRDSGHHVGDFRSPAQIAEHARLDAIDTRPLGWALAHDGAGEHELLRLGDEWPEYSQVAVAAARFLPGISIEGVLTFTAGNGYAKYAIEGVTLDGHLIVRRLEAYP